MAEEQMQQSERKHSKTKGRQETPRDPNLKGGARGGDPEARREPEPEPEVPIVQRYSE